MNVDCVVLDANIAFKALASGRGDLRDRLGPFTTVEGEESRIKSKNGSR